MPSPLVVAVLVFLACNRAFAGEEEIAPTSLPAPVQAAIAASYPGAEIVAATAEGEKGATAYEASLRLGERSLDVAYSAEGEQLEEEEIVAATSLPAPVQATLATYDGWTVRRVERATARGVTVYEVGLVQGSKRMEVMIDADGSVRGKEHPSHAEEQ